MIIGYLERGSSLLNITNLQSIILVDFRLVKTFLACKMLKNGFFDY